MRSLSSILAATLAVVTVSTHAAPAAAQTGIGRLFACDATGQKQEGGAAIGAVLGGLLGSQISKNERTLGAVAGAALGAAAGSYIGCRMQSTDQARAQVFERGLDLLEQAAPGTRRLVRAAETLTPHDLETQFGLSGGQWHQGEVTLDQVFFLRPAASFQRYRMPIPGLWLCGAGAHPGGNVSGAAGANAAREILKSLRLRRAA